MNRAGLRPRQVDLLLAPRDLPDQSLRHPMHGCGQAKRLLQDDLVVSGISGSRIASGEAPANE